MKGSPCEEDGFEEPSSMVDADCECRLYVGNLDQRITESNVIKMFSPFGKIKSEDFLWHTRGPKRGEPRGYAFIQYGTKEEARLAKREMNGRLACGRPLVVRLTSEKYPADSTNPLRASCDTKRPSTVGGASGQQTSRSAKIAAIKNKLRSLEEAGCRLKKPRLAEGALPGREDPSSSKRCQDSD